jgi:general stress protein YciG
MENPKPHPAVAEPVEVKSPKQHRGFARLNKERQREIASKGGKAAHLKGTAHQFSVEEARAAGAKGGKSVSADREHMSRIGRAGGIKRRKGLVQVEAASVRPSQDESADAALTLESIGC